MRGVAIDYTDEELGRRDAELAAGLGVAIGLIAIELVSMRAIAIVLSRCRCREAKADRVSSSAIKCCTLNCITFLTYIHLCCLSYILLNLFRIRDSEGSYQTFYTVV